MDSLALVATVVLLAFIVWIAARNLGGRRKRDRDTAADASTGAMGTWSSGGRRDIDHDHGGDAGGGDGGGGGD